MRKNLILIVIFLSSFFAVSYADKKEEQEPARYRGFTVQDLDQADLREIKNYWGANQVRFMICPHWRRTKQDKSSWGAFERITAPLAKGLDDADKLGLATIVDLHQVPNDNPAPFPKKKFASKEEERNFNAHFYWQDKSNLEAMIKCWKKLATITAKRPNQVIWLELLNEPLDWSEFPRGPSIWNDWAQVLVNEIRKIDKVHPILVATGPGQLWYGFDQWKPITDPCNNLIYTIHMWQPFLYTHQGISSDKIGGWPGEYNDASGGLWNRERIISELHQAVNFQKKHNVRIHVGEIGVATYAPDGAKYLDEVINILEEFGWDWNYHAFREAGVWSVENNNEAFMKKIGKDGKEIRFLAIPSVEMIKEGVTYLPYGTPCPFKKSEMKGLSDRGKVLLKYFRRNLDPKKINKEIKKVLFIGDSITMHAPLPSQNWKGNWGMAASSQDKDFVHLTHNLISDYQGSTPKLFISGRDTGSAGRVDEALKVLDQLKAIKADLIIIQLGENDRVITKDNFLAKYNKLVSELKGKQNPTIICTGTWNPGVKKGWDIFGVHGAKDAFIKQVADKYACLFVPVAPFSSVHSNAAWDQNQYGDGVRWHPGNRGMQAYANSIFATLRPYLKPKKGK